MSDETIEQMMQRAWIECIEADKRARPDFIYINGVLYDAMAEARRQPEICSPAGLASLFPAWGANVRRKP